MEVFKVKPHFTWVAEFNDGSKVSQFDGMKENFFNEVEYNKDKLKKFTIAAEDGEYYQALLNENIVHGNTELQTERRVNGDNTRLIYSRRNQARVEVGTGRVLYSRVIHRIGLETDTDKLVVEVFPGQEMKERFVKSKYTDKQSGEEVVEDLTNK